jgi:tRNA A37 methylthiotransferase MiaB
MLVLYNPVSCASKKPHFPLAMLAVGAVLEGRENYQIVDGNLVADGLTALRNVVRQMQATVVAMTVMSAGPQLCDAVPICKGLKKEFPNLLIVWGGYFPSLYGDVVLKAPYVDYIFRGHSETGFAELITKLRRGEDVSTIPGIGFRNGEAGSNLGRLPPVPDINELPDFPYHRIDMERYIRASFLGRRTAAHHSSYGCPYKCNFCAVTYKVNGRYSAQSAQRTAAVTENLVRSFRADAVEFYDNNFFVQESRIAEFSERIAPLGIRWWAFGRPDTMLKFHDSTWSAMEKSGLAMVFMGAETGDDETLRRMNRGGKHDTNTTLTVADKMRRFNIVPEMSFVLGSPPNPEKDVDITFRFIRRLKQVNPATEIILYMYNPVPVSGDLLVEALHAGFEYPKDLDEWTGAPWEDFWHHRSASLPWVNDRVRRKIRDFQQVLHAAYPTITDPALTGLRRRVLKTVSSWRYATQIYQYPIELRLMNKLIPHRRPEIQGF